MPPENDVPADKVEEPEVKPKLPEIPTVDMTIQNPLPKTESTAVVNACAVDGSDPTKKLTVAAGTDAGQILPKVAVPTANSELTAMGCPNGEVTTTPFKIDPKTVANNRLAETNSIFQANGLKPIEVEPDAQGQVGDIGKFFARVFKSEVQAGDGTNATLRLKEYVKPDGTKAELVTNVSGQQGNTEISRDTAGNITELKTPDKTYTMGPNGKWIVSNKAGEIIGADGKPVTIDGKPVLLAGAQFDADRRLVVNGKAYDVTQNLSITDTGKKGVYNIANMDKMSLLKFDARTNVEFTQNIRGEQVDSSVKATAGAVSEVKRSNGETVIANRDQSTKELTSIVIKSADGSTATKWERTGPNEWKIGDRKVVGNVSIAGDGSITINDTANNLRTYIGIDGKQEIRKISGNAGEERVDYAAITNDKGQVEQLVYKDNLYTASNGLKFNEQGNPYIEIPSPPGEANVVGDKSVVTFNLKDDPVSKLPAGTRVESGPRSTSVFDEGGRLMYRYKAGEKIGPGSQPTEAYKYQQKPDGTYGVVEYSNGSGKFVLTDQKRDGFDVWKGPDGKEIVGNVSVLENGSIKTERRNDNGKLETVYQTIQGTTIITNSDGERRVLDLSKSDPKEQLLLSEDPIKNAKGEVTGSVIKLRDGVPPNGTTYKYDKASGTYSEIGPDGKEVKTTKGKVEVFADGSVRIENAENNSLTQIEPTGESRTKFNRTGATILRDRSGNVTETKDGHGNVRRYQYDMDIKTKTPRLTRVEEGDPLNGGQSWQLQPDGTWKSSKGDSFAGLMTVDKNTGNRIIEDRTSKTLTSESVADGTVRRENLDSAFTQILEGDKVDVSQDNHGNVINFYHGPSGEIDAVKLADGTVVVRDQQTLSEIQARDERFKSPNQVKVGNITLTDNKLVISSGNKIEETDLKTGSKYTYEAVTSGSQITRKLVAASIPVGQAGAADHLFKLDESGNFVGSVDGGKSWNPATFKNDVLRLSLNSANQDWEYKSDGSYDIINRGQSRITHDTMGRVSSEIDLKTRIIKSLEYKGLSDVPSAIRVLDANKNTETVWQRMDEGTDKNGTKVYQWKNLTTGQTFEGPVSTENDKVSFLADSSRIVTKSSDGKTVTEHPDGTTYVTGPNGVESWKSPGGKEIVFKTEAGTFGILSGSTTKVTHDGRTYVLTGAPVVGENGVLTYKAKDSDGKEITFTHNKNGMIEGVSDGKAVFAKGPGETPAAVVGDSLNGSQITGIAYDASTGSYKLTFADEDLSGVIQRDGSQQFKKLIRDKSDPDKVIQRDVTTISSDGLRTIQASYPTEGTRTGTTPSGLTYEIPSSYKETIRRKGTGGEDVNEWTRQSDNTWVNSTGAVFKGERGFLVGTGELLTKEEKPGDPSRNQEDLVKWTLYEHSGGSKEMYFTPESNYRYGISYDRFRRPALIDNGSERTSLTYDEKGELKSVTVVNQKSNTSVTYSRLGNGLFSSPENTDGVKIKVDFGNGTLTWSDAQGNKPVQVFANGTQILSDGTRVDLNPSASVEKRLTKLDDKGNVDPKAGVIEVRTNGDVMYRDGTGKEYLYNPDAGRVYVSGEKTYSFKGKISVDGKGNASIFDEDSDRLRVVNVNGALEQVLERQITQTYFDGSSLTSVGGNSLVYKSADGREITLQGKMDMVNDKPVITLSNPDDYRRLQDFLKEGSVCSQIKFTNGATLEASFNKPGILLYKHNGQIVEIKGQINPLTNEITITDTNLRDDIKAALNSRDYGMPVGLRISLENGATVEPDLAKPGTLIYRQNGIAIPLSGSIDASSGKITYENHPQLTADMKVALDNKATQTTHLSWLKQGGVNETDYVSRDVIVDTQQQPKPNEKGDLVFETPQGKIVYNPAKPNEVSFLDKDGNVVSTMPGTVRVDSQGNAKLILRPESTDRANELTAKLQADGFKILSSGNPPAKIDLDAIGAPVVQQTRTQANMESGTLTGYRPVQAAPELKGPGPVELVRAGLPPASTTTKTDGVAEVTTPDPAAALKLPGSAMNRVVNGQPGEVIDAPAQKAVVQQGDQTAQIQQAVEIRNRVEAIMTRNNLSPSEKEEVRAALASNDLTGAMTRLSGSPVGRTLGDINTEVIKALAPSFPPGKNPELYVAGSLAGLKFAENINTIRATVANRADFDVALAKFYADPKHNPKLLEGFVPPGVLSTFRAIATLPKEVREAAVSAIPSILKSPSGGLGTDSVANSIVATKQQLSAAVWAVSADPAEAARNLALVNAHIADRVQLTQQARDVKVQIELIKGDKTLTESQRTTQIAALETIQNTIKERKAEIIAQEMKFRIPDAVKTALGAMAETTKGKEIIELVKSAMLKNSDELNKNLILALLAMHRDNPTLVKGDNNLAGVTDNQSQSQPNVRVISTPAEVSTLAEQVVRQAVERINQLVQQGAIIDAVYAAQLTTGLQARVEQAIRIAALNRSALDFLPSFSLTGDLGALVKGDSGAKPFASPITTMPIDLNVKYGSLTGRGTTNIITADGTMISIERAMANPALLAHLLATNQISINTLNGVLASADLVRILNIAVAGGLSYTQLTNMSNPELIKYFGAGTVDGVKMGFNVQVGYTSGLVYTSQNGILVPARMGNLEDGIFIQSVQGQKTITEAIKSGSNFVTISNGKNRSDEDDDEDEEDEDGVIVTGSKEDFGGKIPTAQPVTTQTTANHDPTAVLAHNQPVPLPDFLIFPDGSMEPMPAEWKTKANHDHGHVDVIDENGKHMHVIDAKGNILTDQQIEKAKQDRAAAKAAEANAANSDFSPLAPNASLNVPLEISDFIANFDIENQGQAAYIDNDVKQADNLIDPLAHIKSLPIDPNTGFPYDPDTGYILNPNTGDIIGNINDQSVANSISANPFDGRLVDPVTGFPYDPTTGILYDPLTGNPVGSITPEADPIIDLSNEIATIQDNVETRLDDISAYSHVQDALHDAQEVEDIPTEIAADISRPESMDFGTDEEYKEKEKERLDNILNQLEEEEKRLEEQEDELRKRRDEIERLTKLMNSLLATRRQAELDRIRRLIEQQRKIEEFITKDIRRIKYTVRKGDTLENISKKHFRDPRLARLIYEMNPAKIKLSQEEGKTAYQLTLNSVLTLPSPRQAREWISRGKYLTTVDNSYVAQTELTADDLANMEKRRLNVENVLGALGMAADTNYKPSYTVRFGDSLRSIAMKHPALNDVSLWRLLAKVNDMSIETDAMGTPKVTLERGTALNLPSKEEIAQFRKDNGALVHPSSLKHGANGPADLVTNVTLFKECPSCKENTPSGVSLCHCCGHVFQESASGIGPDTKISTVSKQVALTNIGGASTEHDPLAPKQNDDENNVHTLNLPEPERKVANSDVSPLPKTEVDPKGVPNVSAAAKSDITLKLNDPLGSRADAGSGIVSGSSVVPTSDSLLNSMANMHKARKDSSVPSREYQMSKLVENLSDTSRIVLLDSELDLNNQKAERWQLEVLKDDEWTPVVAYEIIGDNSMRHEYNITGKAKKSIKMNLPSAAVEEMVRNDLSRNWQDYCQKFLAGKKLSQ
ncbi:MAG: LysM peptidoglycan-binding domain-containing protein [Candidatus Melainabacteria bacterium]|nr:MAG: LysM peptidoglycan-binding domain-containing protein [Candidatus Melainabacteria bacterium]